jgi:hypothetical protein
MPMPTVVGVGAASNGVAGITPAYPTSYTAVDDDVAVTFAETESTDTLAPPTGWTAKTNQVVAVTAPTKLWIIYRRLVAGDAAPAIADPGDHIVARMIVVRGCVNTGDPFNQVNGTTEGTSDTTVSIPGLTTTADNCLVLAAFGTGSDVSSTVQASGWTNASLANLTERMDNWVTSGDGGGLAMASGEKAVAGVVSATTATVATANLKTLIVLALQGAVAEVQRVGRSPRPSEQPAASGNYAPPVQSQIIGG